MRTHIFSCYARLMLSHVTICQSPQYHRLFRQQGCFSISWRGCSVPCNTLVDVLPHTIRQRCQCLARTPLSNWSLRLQLMCESAGFATIRQLPQPSCLLRLRIRFSKGDAALRFAVLGGLPSHTISQPGRYPYPSSACTRGFCDNLPVSSIFWFKWPAVSTFLCPGRLLWNLLRK